MVIAVPLYSLVLLYMLAVNSKKTKVFPWIYPEVEIKKIFCSADIRYVPQVEQHSAVAETNMQNPRVKNQVRQNQSLQLIKCQNFFVCIQLEVRALLVER